jgi:tetratricopeptide (TPR) repeat protein/4-amino-4-deoxy-L-arabinose transferase-like glycosyltransferase
MLEKSDKHIYLLIAISLFAFFPILFNGFTYYSDDNYVLNNPLIKTLSIDNLKFIFTSFFDGHYHPLTILSFAINYFISGDSPFGYQLTNLLLNTANSVLVYVLIYKLIKEKNIAFAAAMLFALHPLHVESVARITERKDTLYSLFFLISCINYVFFIDTQNIKKYVISVLFFILALFSKGQAVTLPLTLLLISYFLIGYKQTVGQIKYILPLLLLSVVFGILNLKAQTYTGYFLDTASIPVLNYFVSASYVLTNYVFKLFVPIQLSPHYPYPFNLYDSAPIFYYLYLLIFPAVIFVFFWVRKQKILLFGLLFYLINIVLMIRFIPVAENVMPDRYNYIPSLGFVLILVYLLQRYLKSKMMLFVYVISALFFIKTISQTLVWKDGIKVWQTAYKYYPNDSEINQNLGSHYFKKSNFSKASNHLNKSIELDSTNLLAYIDRSRLYNAQQDYKRALNDLRYIVNFQAKNTKDLSNQSAVFVTLGQFKEALQRNNQAIEKNPYNAKLYYNKAAILLYNSRYKEALDAANRCIKLRPHFIGDVHLLKVKIALYNHDVALAQKELKEAKLYLLKTKELENATFAIENYLTYEASITTVKDAKQLNAIGLTYFNLGYYGLAIDYFNKAIELMANYNPAYQNLVYSYYMHGNWEKTSKEYKRAKVLNIEIDNKVAQQLLNLEIE